MKEGVILNIQRMSTEDGPGLRTTVFFKGCTLSCVWCHNPESIDFKKEHEWFDSRCIRCGTCVSACPNNAISFAEDKLIIDYSICARCMECTKVCPSNALEAKGRSWTVDELYDEIIKDSAYFENGGGVTLSGGEVLVQADFAYELLKKLKDKGIHTAVDTCGNVKFENIEKVLDVTSMFLYDIKLAESKMHEKYTGSGNELVLENFKKLAAKIKDGADAKIWVRTPLIPGATDTRDNIKKIARFISENAADQVQRWELLAFNNLCRSKYERLGMRWEFGDAGKQPKDKIEEINAVIWEYENLKGKAFVTGTDIKM